MGNDVFSCLVVPFLEIKKIGGSLMGWGNFDLIYS